MKGRSTHSEGGSGRGSMTALTDWVLSHKRLVVGFWLVVFIAAVAALGPAGSSLSQQFNVPGREGFETNKELAAIYGAGGDVAPIVPVVTLPEGKTVDSPGVRAELAAALAKVEAALPESISASFASTGDRAFVSDDGRTTFALVYIPAKGGVDPGLEEASSAQAAVDGVTVGGSPVEVTGLDALRGSVGDIEGAGAGVVLGTLLAALGALLVLAFVFRSFMAFVPLLMAMVAIPTTFLLVWPLASVTDVSVIVQFLVGLIGLGIAIDYALLVVVRWREERQLLGVSNELAVRNAMQHAGTAVVFSGTTVAISLLALLVLPVPFMRSIGVAGLLIALVSVAVAVTLLPVVLATLGPRFDWPRNRRDAQASRGWSAWARLIVRHRWPAAAASTAVLVALVVAATNIQLGNPLASSLSKEGPARSGLENLEGSGIGTGPLSPFDALVRSGEPGDVAQAFAQVDGVRSAAAPAEWRREGTAIVVVFPTSDGNSPAGRETLDRLRADAEALPAEVTIGGEAAQGADFLETVYGNFPLMVALISILTFILLARAFRSLILPLKAVLLNLLSVAAAWGLIVLIYQKGFGSEAIWGIEATQAINVELPVVIFAFLFGISMDYQVFIISRMREAYDRTGSTEEAVVEGIGRTGRLVTSAAMILFLAFVAFALQPGTEAKIFATALGAGILIDATIIRGVLAPAAVALFGRWNWWLPGWAARILRVEPSPLEPAAPS
jgi:putative drug exporter of the RND superfamily